jgi:hypothetical protein
VLEPELVAGVPLEVLAPEVEGAVLPVDAELPLPAVPGSPDEAPEPLEEL